MSRAFRAFRVSRAFRVLRVQGCLHGDKKLNFQVVFWGSTVDDRNPALPLRTLNYGNYGIFPIMGNAGFISSAVSHESLGFLFRS